MKIWLQLFLASVLTAASVHAQDVIQRPPPIIVIVADVAKDKGILVVEQARAELVPVTETVEVEKDGEKRKVNRTTFKSVTRKFQTEHRLAECSFQTGDGNKV